LTEEPTPNVDASKVGTISVHIKRCKKGPKIAGTEHVAQAATAVAGPINEMQKKSALIGAVTEVNFDPWFSVSHIYACAFPSMEI
jgi:hypothetical protein